VAAVNLPPGAETLQEALQDAGLALLPHTPWQAQGGAPGLTREAGAVTKRSPKGRDSQNEATGKSQLQLQKMKGCAGNAYSLSSAGSMIHYGPVRSGQQLYAEGRSLVVVGSVNDGAELLADGDIHVYGRLAGRAMAGLAGGRGARIFAQDFNPSLFGVADAFVMTDDADAVQGVRLALSCLPVCLSHTVFQSFQPSDTYFSLFFSSLSTHLCICASMVRLPCCPTLTLTLE
jgi:septum formation inhibitor MinC